MVVTPNMNVARRGGVIGFAVNLGRGLGGFLMGKSLSRSLRLSTTNARFFGTPQMLFTNPIIIIHVHKTIDEPPMSSIAIGGYRNTYAENPKGEYQGPSIMTHGIFNYRNGHFVRPNKVAFKYPDFKKIVDLNVHVKVFNYAVKVDAETSENYIINAFNYMLRDKASN
jgi:hypothetical protein